MRSARTCVDLSGEARGRRARYLEGVGLEFLVLLFLVGFFTCGIALPVLAWAGWVEVQRRQLKSGLSRLGARSVDDGESPTADAPIRLALSVGERQVHVAALVRGGVTVWHLKLVVEPGSAAVPFALLDRHWGRPLAATRGMRPVADAHVADAPLALWTGGDGDERGFLTRRVPEATAALGNPQRQLLQCVFDGEALLFEVSRAGLSEREILSWVERLLRFADHLGLVAGEPGPVLGLTSPEGRIAAPSSGNPIGLPG